MAASVPLMPSQTAANLMGKQHTHTPT